MPAEISFFVPESYHKRIIGVGGKNIQRIMKKYGVYVKFSNAEEFAALGGYYENKDNVIARTPAKNAANLGLLHDSILELLTNREKGDDTDIVDIPSQFHRSLAVAHARRIEEMTCTDLIFPEPESGSDTVKIVGSDSQISEAKEELLVFRSGG